MQIMHDKALHGARHGERIIDLGEFRRRQALAQRDSLARQTEEVPWAGEEPAFRPVVLPPVREDRPARRNRRAWVLDACASLSVILMTLLFALRVML